jgi:hypothetical protein
MCLQGSIVAIATDQHNPLFSLTLSYPLIGRTAYMHIYLFVFAPFNLFDHQRSDFIHSRLKNADELIPKQLAGFTSGPGHLPVDRQHPTREALCFILLQRRDVETVFAEFADPKVHKSLGFILEIFHDPLVDNIVKRQTLLSLPKVSLVFKPPLNKIAEILVQKAGSAHPSASLNNFAFQTKGLRIRYGIRDCVNCAATSVQEYE